MIRGNKLERHTMESAICKAITSRKVLSVFFQGDDGYRLLEPYCLGIASNGIKVLHAYQISGYSNSESTSGWKLFRIDSLEFANLTDHLFAESRPECGKQMHAIESVICRL
ncbi:hypothetical protein [Chlorobium limicola]